MPHSAASNQPRRRRPRSRLTAIAHWIAVLFLGAVAVGVVTVVALSYNLPSVEQFETRQISQSTKIYDRDKKVILYETGAEKRTVVPADQIPQPLRDATIAVEDENFYNEPAFDVRGILRAIVVDITNRRFAQGGSTITQQLARNAFLSSEQTVTRKIRELILAIELGRKYSKDQILNFYLNEIPYGPNLYGAETASQAYFNKHVSDLSVAESALLAALPKAPSYYSPWGSHVDELLQRKNLVLKKMLDQNTLSKTQYAEALRTEIRFEPQSQGIKAPHFVMAVQDYLIKKYGEDMVRTGGLQVVTTLDWDLEQAAEKAVHDGALRNEQVYKGKNAALVAEDPKTGQLLALVGSRDYFDNAVDGQFNVATQGFRQPGSALKPFAYLNAFTKGYTPNTALFDVPTEFAAGNPNCPAAVDFSNTDPQCYHPDNAGHKFRGPIAMRDALDQSVNVIGVKTLYLVGIPEFLNSLQTFGITTLTDPSRYGLSLVLGGGEVHLTELTGAYGALAQDGVLHTQTMIMEIKDSHGQTLESYADHAVQAADPQAVRLVNDVLSDTQARAPLFEGQLPLTVFPDYQIAIKTGTTNDFRDVWTFGYTPNLVAGVWAGNNDNTSMTRTALSVVTATPIWHAFMAEALKKFPPEAFIKPDAANPQKPMLNGQYVVNNQMHSILYYVDRNDPAGPPPANPGSDPQFANWEAAVALWAQTHASSSATQAVSPEQHL